VGCTEESCLAEIGSAIGADLLVDTSVGTIGNLRVLALKLIDVKVARVERRQTETVADDNSLVDAGHRLVAELMGLPMPGATSSGKRIAGIGVLAGGAAFAAAGVVFGAVAEGQLGSYRNTEDPNAAAGARNSAHIADGAYGVAVVAALVGAVLFFVGGSTGGTP
jgi:hypothetical protein